MNEVHAALYARVSSEQQTHAGTIRSQLAEIEDRVKIDGLEVAEELRFIDQGFSGGTLLRPALERLRDQVAAGTLDRVYVHSPDRLARKHAYQVVLMDEFQRAGVEIVFLNHELGDSPEDELLLQVQGMIAEYERAKIMERSRRGKRHAARCGSVEVFGGAPYGFRYVTKQEGGGEARWEVVVEEARVVQRIFTWIGAERATIGQVCRKLHEEGVRTRFGKEHWDRTTVWGMLKNPAYKGKAAFGKTRAGPPRPRIRPQRGGPAFARSGTSTYAVPPEDWILVSVPRVVTDALFDTVQEQLTENRRRARKRVEGPPILLQGLVVCKRCGYAYYAKRVSRKETNGKRREYVYYRCTGTDAYRFGGERVCSNKQVRADMLDGVVWQEVLDLLNNPSRLEAEYQRRAQEPETGPTVQALQQAQKRITNLRRGTARIIDGYADGLIEKTEFEPRIRDRSARLARLEGEADRLEGEEAALQQLRLVIGRLEDFARQIESGLDSMDEGERRELIRTLVKRVEIDESEVTVTFRVNPHPFEGAPVRGRLRRCWRRQRRASPQSSIA